MGDILAYIEQNNYKKVEDWVKKNKKDINKIYDNMTLLMMSVIHDDGKIMKLLLENGADPFTKITENKIEYNALDFATYTGKINNVFLLLTVANPVVAYFEHAYTLADKLKKKDDNARKIFLMILYVKAFNVLIQHIQSKEKKTIPVIKYNIDWYIATYTNFVNNSFPNIKFNKFKKCLSLYMEIVYP